MPATNHVPSKFKIQNLYFILAGFDLLTVLVSLGLSSQILGIYTDSVAEQQDWAVRHLSFARVSEMASYVNEPGNDVFRSAAPDIELEYLNDSWRRYGEATREARDILETSPTEDSERLCAGLDQKDEMMRQVYLEAVKTLDHYKSGELEKATECMAQMDQYYAASLSAESKLNQEAVDLRLQRLAEESVRAVVLGRYEWLILGLVACMVTGVLVYGHLLANRFARGETEREQMQRKLIDSSRKAGMADVATGVLHNVGNVLTSISVSVETLRKQKHESRLSRLEDLVNLLDKPADELAEFLSGEKGRHVRPFMRSLAQLLAEEQANSLKEIISLSEHVDHVKQVVRMQQSFARLGGATEPVDWVDIVENAVKMNNAGYAPHGVTVERDFRAKPISLTDRHKVLQIILNLIGNAMYAVDKSDRDDKRIVLRIDQTDEEVFVEVIDNGVGISSENLLRVFHYGFTTKGEEGHGFGLHSCALAAQELGGRLTASSDGLGCGAVVKLTLPLNQKANGGIGILPVICEA